MATSEKDRIARQTADLRVASDMALSNKRKYPVAEFKAFVQSARRYIEITAGDPMIHKSVVRAVNGLREFLEVERKRIPGVSCLRRIDWSANCSLATIRFSMAMSLPAYEPCSRQTRSRQVRLINPWRQARMY
jgi:precorrin-2 methylase